MTSAVPTQVIVAAFDGMDSAKEAFDDLKQLEAVGWVTFAAAYAAF